VVEPAPAYSPETVKTAWHILSDFIIPAIINKEFSSVNEYVELTKWIRANRMAKAGIEAALWDLFAKSKGISLSKMLGGTLGKIVVGVSVGINPDLRELISEISNFLDEGYKRIKLKIEPGNDLKYIEAVRKEFPDILFQVDANSAYELSHVNIFRKMDDYNLLLIEQPLGNEDIYAHSKLQREIKTPICLDESIRSVEDAKAAIELGSCRNINIKPGRVGGYSESILIHNYCSSQNIPVWHGGMDESGIGRAGNIALASLPNFTLPADLSASNRYYKEDIAEPLFTLNHDGTINVPTGPGIGVEINNEKLNKVTVTKNEFKT
jgi:O-succinylbenzoate synthase